MSSSTGGGIIGSVGRVLRYLLIIGVVAGIGALVVIMFLQDPPTDISRVANRTVNTLMAMVTGRNGGAVVGRAVGGVDPPSIPARLASLEASRSIATPAQEIIMIGSPTHPCLGGDTEVMLEVKNDIGSDQLDISYYLENLIPVDEGETVAISSRVTKIASCGPESVIRQCIPLAPEGRGVRLTTLAYYNMGDDGNHREEKRIYPSVLNNEALKATGKIELNASAFEPVLIGG